MRKTTKLQALLKVVRDQAHTFQSKLVVPMWTHAIDMALTGNKEFLNFIDNLEEIPVDIETFIDSEEFLGSTDITLWPEVRRAVIEINQNWWKGVEGGAYKEAILAGATGCVDADTEFLSASGWKRIADYVEGELVMQYTEEGRGEFVHPNEYINLPCKWMYHFHAAGSIDQKLSPEHHVIFFKKDSGELDVCTAHDAAQIHNSKGFKGNIKTTFEYPKATDTYTASLMALKILTSHKSCVRKSRSNYSVTLKTEDTRDVLAWICNKAQVAHRITDNKDGTYTYDIESRLVHSMVLMENLAISSLAVNIVEPLIISPLKTGGMFYVVQSKETADYLQLGLAINGERSYVFQDDTGSWQVKGGLTDMVALRSRDSRRHYEKVEQTDTPDGRKYCFSVPSSMLVLRRNGNIFITGNTGKTEITKITMAYHLHILGCMKNPQKYWGLPSATSIVMPIQAAKPHVVKRLIYTPLRKYIEGMPWFRKKLRPDPYLESEMYFVDKNIRIFMGNADDDAILGEAVIACAVDEINFMVIVEKSKKAAVDGRSGKFDQAKQIYTALSSRKKGRFTNQGVMVGILCISSSTKYKGDFTDQRIEEANLNDEQGVYVYRKMQHQVKPADRFCGKRFKVVVSNELVAQTRMLKEGETLPEGAHIVSIPIEFKDDFEKDIYRALRDYCGIADRTISPFIRNRDKLQEAFLRWKQAGNVDILVKPVVELAVDGMPQIAAGIKCKDKTKPRYIHIDLSINNDPCGVSMIRFDGMVTMERAGGITERLPKCTVEFAATIIPSETHEIDIAEVRAWAQSFKSQYGFPVKQITYDQFQSVESRQELRKQGVKTQRVSVDESLQPYVEYRDAIYDGRVDLYPNPQLMEELYNLEYDAARGKIDHPVNGSKDTADSSCGAYKVMLTRSSTWTDNEDREERESRTRDELEFEQPVRRVTVDRPDTDRRDTRNTRR